MIQRQYSDAELDILAAAVQRLSSAHARAKASSIKYADTMYIYHAYGTTPKGERIDEYRVSTKPYGGTMLGITEEAVAKYVRGQEVNL
jgi:hypothetical protein